LSELQITVAVAACGRPTSLARCLQALASGSAHPWETIVVDQAPSHQSRQIVERCGIAGARYLEQPQLGVSASRNLALTAARGETVAVIDDDCAPDPGWLTAVSAAFARAPTPAAVTGPVLPLGVQPPGTFAISLRTGERAVDYGGRTLPWIAGTGGNFAARRELLRRLAGWDERLGPGSPGRAAEDSDLMYRIMRDGGVVRYEPGAAVRHEWQTRDRRLATRYSYAYGTGALCGLHLRRRDGFALRILAAYAKDHLMALAGAVRRRDRGAGVEHRRALAGLLPGLLYGLRAGALPVGAHPSIAMYTNAG